MPVSIGTAAGNKTSSARFVGDGTGATRTVAAAYIGTAAGNKQIYGATSGGGSGGGGSGGGGGGGGGTAPAFGVAIAPDGTNLGNIHVGQTLSSVLTAQLSAGSSALNAPFTYSWSATLTGNGVTIALSATTGSSITFSETGANVGNGTEWLVTVVATDAGGVTATAQLSGGVNTTS